MTGPPAVLTRLGAITRRDLAIQLSYHFQLVFSFVGTAAAAFLAFYVAKLVGEPESLSAYRGSYFDFVVIGLALTSYAGVGVAAFTMQISQEQSAGTLEILLTGPTRIPVILAGGFLVPFGITTLEVALLLLVGLGLLGAGLSTTGLLLAVPVVLLTVANFCALGIASAALVLLAKRGDPISRPLFQLTLLLSGAIFPVALFPSWLQALCYVNPAYYGVSGLRLVLLGDPTTSEYAAYLAVLAGFAAVGLPLSVAMFSWAVRKAKRLGILATY